MLGKAEVRIEMKSLQERFDDKWTPEPFSGCWLWTGGMMKTGYGGFAVDRRINRAHRVAWMLYKGTIPKGKLVLHSCDIRCCVTPAHLFLGSHADNSHDAIAKGRFTMPPMARGERNGMSKLTKSQVVEILASMESSRRLAKRFGVSQSTVAQIRTGRVWTHVK
jgi:hypothetical protein